MGEIRPKECEPRELTKDQLAAIPRGLQRLGGDAQGGRRHRNPLPVGLRRWGARDGPAGVGCRGLERQCELGRRGFARVRLDHQLGFRRQDGSNRVVGSGAVGRAARADETRRRSCPFFAHFTPFFAHFLRLGARKPDSAKERRKNGGKRGRNGRERVVRAGRSALPTALEVSWWWSARVVVCSKVPLWRSVWYSGTNCCSSS